MCLHDHLADGTLWIQWPYDLRYNMILDTAGMTECILQVNAALGIDNGNYRCHL